MSTLPKDPMILLSYINTQLRDNYSSLGEMCQVLDLDELHIRKTLSDIGFEYVSEKNCFRQDVPVLSEQGCSGKAGSFVSTATKGVENR